MKLRSATSLDKLRQHSMRRPLALTSVWLWLIIAWVLARVDPSSFQDVVVPGSYLPMVLLIFITISLSVWVISQSKMVSMVWSGSAVGFLLLRIYHIGHLLNLLLLLGIALSAHLVIVMEKKQT